MNKTVWIGALAILVLGLLCSAALYVWSQRYTEREITAIATADPSCNLQGGACQATFSDGGRITLSLRPRPIQSLQPIQIEVQTEALEIASIAVDFRGQSMDMGYNRPQLSAVSPSHYSGSGMLASCALERMSWEVTVLATTDRGVLAAPFVFQTLKP
jgi:hypothetical protein